MFLLQLLSVQLPFDAHHPCRDLTSLQQAYQCPTDEARIDL
jgi:hypothetical protein